jgi:putative SOS response-associated peptidase YedK
MCGRFNVTSDPLSELLIELVGMRHPGPDNYNCAPTEAVNVLRLDEEGQPELVPMRWWLTPNWAKEMSAKYSMFNAKSETAAKSPAFREPMVKRRCVVPVSGFYEWQRRNNQKMPLYITPVSAPGMLLAGLWDRWHNRDTGEVTESFAILTTAANEAMKFVHSRQPVMLSLGEAHRWMDASSDLKDLNSLFDSHLPVDLHAIPVSTLVNNARNKEPRCAEPVGEPQPIGEF